jgi:hypothetical protein
MCVHIGLLLGVGIITIIIKYCIGGHMEELRRVRSGIMGEN